MEKVLPESELPTSSNTPVTECVIRLPHYEIIGQFVCFGLLVERQYFEETFCILPGFTTCLVLQERHLWGYRPSPIHNIFSVGVPTIARPILPNLYMFLKKS